MMREYFPADYEKLRHYVKAGRWFPAGSSMEENDVNSPSRGIDHPPGALRQRLTFRHDFGVASQEFMLPDCFGFPASLPSALAAAGVKGFSTQKLRVWGSSAPWADPTRPNRRPKGIPFNVGIWDGPGGRSVIAAFNPAYLQRQRLLRRQQEQRPEFNQHLYYVDWPKRMALDGKATGLPVDYHYYGTGDIGGSPAEASVKLVEDIVTTGKRPACPLPIERGDLDVDQAIPPKHLPFNWAMARCTWSLPRLTRCFSTSCARARRRGLPHFKGDLELTNHSAGSLTSRGRSTNAGIARMNCWLTPPKRAVRGRRLAGRRPPIRRSA